MKKLKDSWFTVFLFISLLASLIFNCLQMSEINRLVEEVKECEYTDSLLMDIVNEYEELEINTMYHEEE